MGTLAVPPRFMNGSLSEELEPPPPPPRYLQHNVLTSLQSFWRVHEMNPVSGDGRLVELVTVGLRWRPLLGLCCAAQVSLSEQRCGGGGD